MKMDLRIIVLIIFINVCLWMDSNACTCNGIPTIKESIEQADVIVSGRVISIEYLNNLTDLNLFNAGVDSLLIIEIPVKLINLLVEYTYEGLIITDTLQLITPATEAACGVNFQIGGLFIVYASIIHMQQSANDVKPAISRNLIYLTWLCTRTMSWRQSEHDGLINAIKN